MFTLNKLNQLGKNTRLRKISIILHQGAMEAFKGTEPDIGYLESVLDLASTNCPLKPYKPLYSNKDLKALAFLLEDLSQQILKHLGAEPSDWDFTDDEGQLDISKRTIQNKILILDRLRSPYNVGAIFRSADSFGIKKIILVEETASPEHPRAQKTSRGCTSTVEWEYISEKGIVDLLKTYDSSTIMALELGGENINTCTFPSCGVAILGSEEMLA